MGDIGQMFSDKNKKFKNIRSTILLQQVIDIIKLKGSSPANFLDISHCFISSLENTISFLGLNFFKVIGINLFPKEPVPPVTNIIESLNIKINYLNFKLA